MRDIEGKNVLVVGLGVSGYAAARLLAEKGAKVRLTESSDTEVIRTRMEELTSIGVECEIGGHTESYLKDAEILVLSPGVDQASLPIRPGPDIEIIGELELGYSFCRAPIIAITGTNGKSTTTKLIGDILALSGKHTVVCGNIGNPLCGEVNALTEDSVAVVEVSSFQLETIKEFKPHIAILLNVSEDHYDRHGSYDAYKASKFRIFANQSTDDWAVLHADLYGDPLGKTISAGKVYFGEAARSLSGRARGDAEAGRGVEKAPDISIPLRGVHNRDNAACAFLVSNIMGIDKKYIKEGISAFKGLDHRFEMVGAAGEVEFIDDSKATNIDATRKALESMDKKVVLIAGGRDKGGDYLSIMPLVKDKVKAMVIMGEAGEKIKNIFSSEIPVLAAGDMPEAVKRAFAVASRGEAVMLSPMCSSFDMYSSYKERGNAFQAAVRDICAGLRQHV